MNEQPKSPWDEEVSPRLFVYLFVFIIAAGLAWGCWTSWLNHQYRIEQLRVQPSEAANDLDENDGEQPEAPENK